MLEIEKREINQKMIYQLRIEGQLDSKWKNWFGGMSIIPENDGNTIIYGPVVDQAELYGLLKKVRDLGLVLVSVNRITTD